MQLTLQLMQLFLHLALFLEILRLFLAHGLERFTQLLLIGLQLGVKHVTSKLVLEHCRHLLLELLDLPGFGLVGNCLSPLAFCRGNVFLIAESKGVHRVAFDQVSVQGGVSVLELKAHLELDVFADCEDNSVG